MQIRTLVKLGIGLAMSAGATGFALATPLGAAASVSSVTVYNLPFTEGLPGPTKDGIDGVIAHVNGSCANHCSAVINWGDGSPPKTIDRMQDANGHPINDVMASHQYNEEGPFPLTVTAQAWNCCFQDGAAQTGALVQNVTDDILSVISGTTLGLAEGVAFSGFVGSFQDSNSNGTLNDFSAQINWGDGSTSPGTISRYTPGYNEWHVSGSHTYRTARIYAVSATVSDHGATVAIPITANVADVGLNASGINGSWTAGSARSHTMAQFTDQNPGAVAGDFTASIDWGDNTSSAGSVTQTSSQNFSVSGAHSYANAGNYTATVSIHDSGGSSATPSAPQTVDALLVLPTLINGAFGGYQTTIYIQNVSDQPANISINYYDSNGTLVGTGDQKTALAPHAGWSVRQNNGHSFSAGGAGSGVITTTQPIAAFVNEFANDASDASSYTAIRAPTDTAMTLYAPTIANNAFGGYTTGIGVLNWGIGGSITVTYRDPAGVIAKEQSIDNVASGAFVPVFTGTAGLPVGWYGTATITGPGPMAAVINETGPNGQFSSYDAVSKGSYTLNAPTTLNNGYGGFYTGTNIQNTWSTGGTVTIDYFDSAGTKTEKVKSIPAYGYIPLFQGNADDGPPPSPTGYTLRLTSTVPIAAIVNETAPPFGSAATMSTSYNTFEQGAAQMSLPLVENAGADGWSTGLGVMNTGSVATTVTLSYYDAGSGLPVGTSQTDTIQPNSFWGPYQPQTGLPPGMRATAVLTASVGGQIAVICNENGANVFMSYDGQ